MTVLGLPRELVDAVAVLLVGAVIGVALKLVDLTLPGLLGTPRGHSARPGSR